jgi:excisionase family DNA binding protein
MADPYQPPDGYMTMAQAQEALGVSKVTILKRVRDRGLETYRDPRDTRVRLLKVEDVERMKQLVAEPPPAKKAA